ncbi:MAG: hypothetical protein ACOZIN_01140 [Myxococcota bacterium]
MMRLALFMVLTLSTAVAYAAELSVDPNAGNNTFSAVFDAKLGERITATSSAVECAGTYDEKAGTISGRCSVPLTSIKVDNEETKTEHFQQWATNKKMEAKDCAFEATLSVVKVGKLVAERPVSFSTDVPFTICGRSRDDGGKENVHGSAVLFPPGSYGEAKTIRIRATVSRFNREQYLVGPKHTEGWLGRVQSLAKVVADEGTVELSLFAKVKETSPAK